MEGLSDQNQGWFEGVWRTVRAQEPEGGEKPSGREAPRSGGGLGMSWPASHALALAVTACAPAAAAADRGAIAILPFKLLDTSSEPVDQRADHDRRLKAMGEALRRELRGPGTFAGTSLMDAGAIARSCPTETPDCLFGAARAEGAQFALFGALHKSSTLIMQLFLTVVEVDSRDVVVSREFNFRGDNDESWMRAKDFLVREIRRDLESRRKASLAAAPPR